MYFACDLGIDFRRKINAFCIQSLTFLYTLTRKGVFYYKDHRFSTEIDPQIACKIRQKIYNFYFMLQMYNLMLESVESVWERL